ncbi:NUDIX hydrolase [Cupriavidus basilensis]
MKPTKACPVVLRTAQNRLEILAFEHPLAGPQIIKGTIEAEEHPADAAVRELCEESGVNGVATVDLGLWQSGYEHQIWSLHLCEATRSLPDTWVHHAKDDGGHDFRFFWHPLGHAPSDRWHWLFRNALSTIEIRLAELV